jgi:hypothetical protein
MKKLQLSVDRRLSLSATQKMRRQTLLQYKLNVIAGLAIIPTLDAADAAKPAPNVIKKAAKEAEKRRAKELKEERKENKDNGPPCEFC